MNTLWLNGKYMPLADGQVSVEDRSLQFGDGIYEVIVAYNGMPVLMEEHLDRWDRSAAGLGIEQVHSRETRRSVIQELVRTLGTPRTMIYGQLSRGTAKRAHPFPKNASATEIWYVRELAPYPEKWYTEGVSIVTHVDERWSRCWIKATCLLPNVLAKQYAVDHGAFDSILVMENGNVTESSAGNAYAIKNGTLFTHPANGRILAGVKRGLTLDLARAHNIPVREEVFSLDFLRTADEIFVTSTTINILPVTRLDGHLVGTGRVGDLTKRLGALVDADVRRRSDVAAAV